MRYCLLLSICLYLCSVSCAQTTGTLKGTITDRDNKQSIPFTNIFDLTHKVALGQTNLGGNFSFDLKPGDYAITCTFIGYQNDTFYVNINSGVTTEHNVIMKKTQELINEVVVSAGKYDQDLSEVTQSMEVLSPKTIENRNALDVSQALDQVPGLNILDQDPQIRGGSGFSFGVGSRVAVLVDGIPLLAGDVGKPDWGFIPMENLDQIEVIKGTSSVLYGSSAMSGTINFLTSYPTKPHETKVRIFSGLYNAPPGEQWWPGLANYSGLSISQAERTNTFDLTVSATVLYDHGYIGPDIPIANSSFPKDTISNNDVGSETGRMNFNFRYRPKNVDGLSMGINGNFMLQKDNYSLIWENDSNNLYRAFPATMTLSNTREFYVDPFITYFSPSGWEQDFKSRIYVTDNENTNGQSTTDQVYYTQYQVSKDFQSIKDLHLTTGIMADADFSEAALFSSSGSPDNYQQNYAYFIQADKKFWNALSVSVGFRDEYFHSNDLKAVNKPVLRAGLNYKLAKGTFLRASYGQGYRYPAIAERYVSTSVGGISILPNPSLVPETSWNAELGIMQGFKISKFYGFLDAAFFWQQYYNTIEYNYAIWAPDSTGFKFVNTGTTRVKGIDVSLNGSGNITKNISVTIIAGYTYTDPQSLQPDYVYATENPGEGFIPRQLSYASTSTDTANNILKYRFQTIAKADIEVDYKKSGIGFTFHYYSYMQNIDNTFYQLEQSGVLPSGIIEWRQAHSNGTWVYDARATHKFGKYYKASLIVNNLFNLEYSLRPLKIEPMRTIGIELTADI